MDNFIVTAKKEDNTEHHNEYYAYVGQEEFVDDNNNLRLSEDGDLVMAKKIFRDNGSFKLMIKCDRNNKPFDPDSPFYQNSTVASYKNGFRFVMVNQKAFNYYLKFLQTKNKSWLLNTERELT